MNSAIERLVSLRVADAMSNSVDSISANATMADAARIMLDRDIRGMPVVDEQGHCVGILTTTDYVVSDQSDAETVSPQRDVESVTLGGGSFDTPFYVEVTAEDRVKKHMTSAVQAIDKESSLIEAGRYMCNEHVHRLVVLDDSSRPVGMITSLDLAAALIGVVEE